ncbi:MBL fold metallo-hydrolase [Arthrobacter sp. zg-Y820]|uniref:MBL fold metallo-hydrolase n=1 Tax=unclassified Arthrobacter TaxID=235627 RepID=UPI00253FCD33|nr:MULTISPECIES: MBL fold metallo-hydrolase [unclassified Arthrobacter]MCC9195721.1 MBL fold metallo-hydrolase [Arthrobacter sp. zg-Y820]MDK1278580.1 MBL fold metallo-hydrolase [Arthrobacter sp. zg.Y820]WIB08987.1 MBL fold metallo-hydrolase [Arthrobacter sp. zg-Y820]
MFTRNVAEGIHRIEHAYVNTYLVEDDNGLAIIDAGLPGMWPELVRAVKELGYGPGSVSALVLTHAHFDHVGTAARIRQKFRTPILVHDADRYIAAHPYRYEHENNRFLYPVRYPRSIPYLGAMTAAGALNVRGVTDVHSLGGDSGSSLPGRPRILHTPGHTAGHVALHYPERDALICGDSLVTLNPYTGAKGPQIVSGAATANSPEALESLGLLAKTKAPLLLTGHGEPWTGGAEAAVQQALARGAS